MIYLLSLPFSLVVVGLFMTIRAASCAPEGYEDEAGFHFSSEGAPAVKDRSSELSLGAREALIFR